MANSQYDSLQYPGFFATRGEIEAAQQAAQRFAARQEDPAQVIANEREIRYRVAYRGGILFATVYLPLLLFGLYVALQFVLNLRAG